mgnify:CR=1 FL=1
MILSLESFVGDKSSPINFSQSINDFIESKVKLHPDEYLWQHRRFKSTLGKDNFYKWLITDTFRNNNNMIYERLEPVYLVIEYIYDLACEQEELDEDLEAIFNIGFNKVG